MCGIAGFIGKGSQADLTRMTEAMIHRGPDGEGHLEDPELRVWLGHRRLAIVDLADGKQPMATADGQLVVVFNGEIYNHLELRSTLQACGHVFVTDHSDTEVLIHGYREWGRELVHRLNGMWAFALLDRRNRQLWLSRDRFGQKPLYYARRPDLFAFASELTALMTHGDLSAGLSILALQKYFAYGFIPAPHTVYDKVHKLPAGHELLLDLDDPGAARPQRYWRYRIEPQTSRRRRSLLDLSEELRHHLSVAVERRLMADVPLGVFLSGGLDSSVVTALAAKHQGPEATPTFSIAVEHPSFDESAHAARVAQFIGTPHRIQRIQLQETLEQMPSVIARLDEPLGDSSVLPTWAVCQSARERVTVALGGDGADELLAGYTPFLAMLPSRLYSRLMPPAAHRLLAAAAERLPTSHNYMSLDFKLKRALRGLDQPRPLWAPLWMGPLDAEGIAELFGRPVDVEELYSESWASWEECDSPEPLDKLTSWFVNLYLQDDILTKVDRTSMMCSLEVRSPFLDIDLVNFCRTLPVEARLHRGRTTKALLRLAARDLVPKHTLKRSKQGFSLPVGSWFRSGDLQLYGGLGLQDAAVVNRRSAAHKAGKLDDRLFLYCQWVLESFAKNQ